MYKQCFELLTAQGPKPHKSFSVSTGASDVSKEYDAELKNNIFNLTDQRIQLPPNPSQAHTDFHNNGAVGARKAGVQSSLNVVHQFLIFQIYVATGDPFQLELHVRDKHNTRRRLMFCEGTKQITTNQMHARIPNHFVVRDKWTNLCIDVNSFIKECFSRNGTVHGTPQIAAGQQPLSSAQKAVGGGSGDIAALHGGRMEGITGQGISKIAAVMSKHQNQSAALNQNSMKTIEVIQLEGCFKIRKIFTSRSQIPADLTADLPFGAGAAGATAISSGVTMRPEDIIQAAMVGQRIEQIPKNFDFSHQVERLNQVLNYDIVSKLSCDQRASIGGAGSTEDQMIVAGFRVTAGGQQSSQGFPSYIQDAQPGEVYSNDQRSSAGGQSTMGSFLNIKHGGSGLKLKGSQLHGVNNDRKSSLEDNGAGSPFLRGTVNGSAIGSNYQEEGSNLRKGTNLSKNGVMVIDQEEEEQLIAAQEQQALGTRRSNISIKQGQKHMKISVGTTNIGEDVIFNKQANSTTSNHGQRSNQTQSTAYSVRTTSSGRQKGKLGSNLQSSQSPFTENNNNQGVVTGPSFTRKRSLHASNGRPVYEQVDEMEESGSGTYQLGENKTSARLSSPPIYNQPNGAQSAKINRKGVQKTNIDTNLPKSSEKMQLLKAKDPMATPKLSQLQEVHKTTILEENETMRGSIDRIAGSKLSLYGGASKSTNKKFNRVQAIDQKKGLIGTSTQNLSAAGTRKGPLNSVFSKNVRTKSSVGGSVVAQEQQANLSYQQQQQHPMVRSKQGGNKMSVSSSNLEDSIGGIVGNRIQKDSKHHTPIQSSDWPVHSSIEATNTKQISTGARQSRHHISRRHGNIPSNQKNVSPKMTRKQPIPKNQLQISEQKRRAENQPQFQVGNGRQQRGGLNTGGKQGAPPAAFLYNGSGYGTNNQTAIDSDGEQSDFKTTTLRFTNNNFIENTQKRERESSQGNVPNRESLNHNSSLLNTLNSQNNVVQQIAKQNVTKTNKFGTSDNFKANAYMGSFDQRTDGFNRLANGGPNKSPISNNQFSTMNGMLRSEGGAEDGIEDEEEQIEEDICGNGESPLINAQTKQQTGQKAKVLFQAHQPPMFRSTESENFKLDTMSNFGQIRAKDATPVHDKNSVLASKPFLGGKARHQLIKSPDKSYHQQYGGTNFNSNGGGVLTPDMRLIGQQKEIEEEIGVLEDTYEAEQNAMGHSQSRGGAIDPNDTCTSDFYQIPVQGGIPVQLTIENGRRPFTPPFAQLVKVSKPSSSQSARRAALGAPPQKVPDFVNTSSGRTGVMTNNQKNELKQDILLINEDQIEEEIDCSPMQTKNDSSKQGGITTQDSSSDAANSKGQKQQQSTLLEAAPIVDFSESLKRRNKNNLDIQVDTSGSNVHTFGRRSRAENNMDNDNEDGGPEELARDDAPVPSQRKQNQPAAAAEIAQQKKPSGYYQADLMDPQMTEQKKRLLYDKSLKAYYDPETGQYFEMKPQLIAQSSISQLEQNHKV